jgi:uncharacterized membrane protein YphA (DoxX/SURF4 family)
MTFLGYAGRALGYPPVVLCLRIALGVVFIAASIDKIQNPGAFAESIANYRIVPYPFIHAMAITLPWLEIVIGCLLVLGVWTRANAAIAFGLLLVFVFAISQALIRNLDISCGCFVTSPSAHRMTRWTLYWDLIWIGWATLILLQDRGRFSVASLFRDYRRSNR